MTRWLLLVTSIALLLWASPVAAQTPPEEAFTLAMALRVMRAQHPALASADGDLRAAAGDAVDAALWTNPTLSASWTPGLRNSSYDASGYTSVALTQFVELSGAPGARGRAADALTGASRLTREDIARRLALDVEAAMAHLVAAQRRVALLRQTRERLGEVQRVVDDRVAAGATPRYDASRMRSAVALAQADLDAADADLDAARTDFVVAVGPGARELRGAAADALDAPRPAPSLAELLTRLTDRPDIGATNLRADAADAAVSAARRAVFPGVGVQLVAGYGASPGQVDLGVGLTVPLPVVDRGQGSIAAAQGRADAARATATGLLALETERLRGAFAVMTRRRDALATFRASASGATEEALAEARAGYSNGRFNVLDLADAYSAWSQTRLREVDLLEAARQAEINLARVGETR